MTEMGGSLVLPKPRDAYDLEMSQQLDEILRDVIKILNRGILFNHNIDCKMITFTTSATPDAENTTAHTLGKVPNGFIIYSQDKAGSLYDSGTAHNATNIYTKCSVASVTFKVIVI